MLMPSGRAVVFDKFVPEGQRPSRRRHLANLVTSVVFSDITRTLEPLLASTPLRIEHREAAGWGGAYEIVRLRRSREPTARNDRPRRRLGFDFRRV